MTQNMGRWFRFYEAAVSNTKIIKLSDADFRAWVNILCLAASKGGVIPPIDDVAIMLRLKERDAQKRIDSLIAAGLIDKTPRGLVPHDWDSRQFQSDGSTARVKRFRERQKGASGNVSETLDATFGEQDMQRFDSESASAYESVRPESLSGQTVSGVSRLKGAARLRSTGGLQ